MSKREKGIGDRGAAPLPAPVAPWIAAARRRMIALRLLRACGWAVAADIALIAAVELVDRAFGLRLTSPDVSLPLFAVLAFRAFARTPGRDAAALLDRQLALKDALASALDFARRPGVDPAFRDAQLAETARELAARGRVAQPRIPPLLWAAPALFVGLLVSSNLTFFLSAPPQLPRWAGGPAPGVAPVAERSLPGQPGAGPAAPPAAEAPGEAPEGAQPAGEQPGEAEKQAQQPAPAPTGAGERTAGRQEEPPEGHGPGGGASGGDIPEPAQLFSETETAALTAVEEPGPQRAAPPPPAEPPQGSVSFQFVPTAVRSRAAGGPGGEGVGGDAPPLEVTVDFDAIPPGRREQVRRYFDWLQRTGKGESRGPEG